MQLKFIVSSSLILKKGPVIALRRDSWDDFGFKTSFRLEYIDPNGQKSTIGTVKIACIGQKPGR